VAMSDQITVVTDLFEHKEVKPHFINPCCFGEDFAAWLLAQLAPLREAGFELSEPIQEDYGWGLWARHGADAFWIALGCVEDAPTDGPAEWVVSVDYDPGLNIMKRLFHKPDPQAFARLCDAIRHSVASNPRMRVVAD
jgi:hypothetical protein